MNIFVLADTPEESAQLQGDKHVIKMILESAQMLCSAFEPGSAPYKRTHYNHPCSVWARKSEANYSWLVSHAFALCAEYTRRYGRRHKTEDVIEWCALRIDELPFSEDGLTPFAQAVPDQFKHTSAVVAYRAYYADAKRDIATYTRRPEGVPQFMVEMVDDSGPA
jgi:hypothetical protein